VEVSEPELIGVDGGASGVRVARVERRGDGRLACAHAPLTASCDPARGADAWLTATAELVERAADGASVRVGMGMPGRKTADGRGIASALHGPVDPQFLERLEADLVRRGVQLARPIAGLFDDGLLGAAGELVGAGGVLGGAHTAYALGGGTGLAEAFVFDGRPVVFEGAPVVLERAYRIAHDGRSFEERVSVRGLNARFAALGGDGAPEDAFERGDERARVLFGEVFADLAALVEERERTLSLRFERIALSQRLARLLLRPRLRAQFESRFDVQRYVLSSNDASNVIGAAWFASEAR
jgi:hypothetical protein